MIISKILNNNVITTIDENTKLEKVVMGRGLAFKKKVGELVDIDRIEKVFIIQNANENLKFQMLVNKIPMEHVRVSEKIISYAREKLNTDFDEHIYIALTDHISFAIDRYKKDIKIKNNLLWEIQRIHKNEYDIGIWALQYIEKELGIKMDLDEVGFIAMHLVYSSLNMDLDNSINITTIIKEILNIIKYTFSIEFDENDISYDRLITHLKFFAQRIMVKKQLPNEVESFLKIIKMDYEKAYKCVLKIKEHIYKNYDYNINDAEIVYLTMHVQRIITSSIR